MTLSEKDLSDLRRAKFLLENPGIAAKITNMIGRPIETGFKLLPKNWNEKIGNITKTALTQAVNAAVLTLKDVPTGKTTKGLHKLAVATSGGIGGFFGLTALALELPISTTIMLRSIADVARSEGESVRDIESKMAMIEVFAFGGGKKSDDASDSGYFAVRTALARSVAKAAEFIGQKGFAEEGAPALVRVIAQVAQRFSIQVSEKAAAQAVPALGAAGGALINTLFIDHFQNMAHGHFTVRRLERIYGKGLVKDLYLNG